AHAASIVDVGYCRYATLKHLDHDHVSDIEQRSGPTERADTAPATALDRLRQADESALLVLDEAGRPRRWVGAEDLRRADGRRLDDVGLPASAVVEPRATLSDALNELITARYAVTLVVDDEGVFQGVVDIEQINEAIRSMRASAVREARAGLEDG